MRGEDFKYRFEIDALSRNCLLRCLDEIRLVERHDTDNGTFEHHRNEWLPVVG